MFCDEIIEKVYIIAPDYENNNANYFLDCHHDITYHVTEGYRIVLETKNYLLSLGAKGVQKHSKDENIVSPDEYMEECIHHEDEEFPWVDFEATLFVGERLVDVAAEHDCYIVEFDDFTLKIIPYEDGNMVPGLYNENHWSYNHVYGCERLLKRKCNCGGTGEVLIDFVSDYVVRCKKCKKSTYAGMNIKDAIEDWNDGIVECDLENITIE